VTVWKNFKHRAVTQALSLVTVAALTIGGMAAYRNRIGTSNTPPLSDNEVAPLIAFDRAMENVAERVTPAVVNISAVAHERTAELPQDGGDLPPFFGQFFGPGSQFFGQGMMPRNQVEHVGGSGVIISPDGYIVTNNHVVKGVSDIRVTLNDKREFAGRIVGTDPLSDLAVVKINADNLPNAPWGDSRQLKPGETVLAIGNPLGLQFTVTRGIISALNRPRLADDPRARGSYIQTDAAITFGNSGGPLVDVRGQVIGIDTAMYSTNGGYAGIGFAIPSNLARNVAEQLIEHGKVVRGYIGIGATDVTPAESKSLGLTRVNGALVNQVEPNGPAAKSGLRVYDVITGVNGTAIASADDLQSAIGQTAPGSTAKLEVMRDGKPTTVTVLVGELGGTRAGSDRADASSSGARLGIQAGELTPEIRDQLQLPAGINGVLVASTEPGGPADNAGISRGDVILQVNRHPVSSVASLREQLRQAGKGTDLMLLVFTHGSSRIVIVHPQQ
jgi:serine protease Do